VAAARIFRALGPTGEDRMPGSIRVDRADNVATVSLDNPAKLNAIDAAMWRALRAAMTELAGDPAVRCVVLRGAGDKAFAAGGDLEEFATVRATVDDALHYHDELVAAALDAVRRCPVPTVAAIQGACVGGGLEIAGCCDLRIAGESARFGAPINKLGFSMYPGEMAGLLALVGPAVLLEILLEGRILDAREALAKGLLTRVVDDERVLEEALATAGRICAGAPLVARWHKAWVRRLTSGAPLSEAEKRAAFAFLDTADYREGMAAFRDKRPPRFSGR
jgi:enoyl-CoA hydratase/carnithine racemase